MKERIISEGDLFGYSGGVVSFFLLTFFLKEEFFDRGGLRAVGFQQLQEFAVEQIQPLGGGQVFGGENHAIMDGFKRTVRVLPY